MSTRLEVGDRPEHRDGGLKEQVQKLKFELKACRSERDKLRKEVEGRSSDLNGDGNDEKKTPPARDHAISALAEAERQNEELAATIEALQLRVKFLEGGVLGKTGVPSQEDVSFEANSPKPPSSGLETVGLLDDLVAPEKTSTPSNNDATTTTIAPASHSVPAPAATTTIPNNSSFPANFAASFSEPESDPTKSDEIMQTLSVQLEETQEARGKLQARVMFLEENVRMTNMELEKERQRVAELKEQLSQRPMTTVPLQPSTTPDEDGDLRKAMAKLETILEEKTLEALQLKESLLTHSNQRTQMRRLITRAKDRLRTQEMAVRTLKTEKKSLEQKLSSLRRHAKNQILEAKRAEAEARREMASLRQFYAKAAAQGTPPPGQKGGRGAAGLAARNGGRTATRAPERAVTDLHDWGSPSKDIEDDAQAGLGDWFNSALSSATTALSKLVDEGKKGAPQLVAGFHRHQSAPAFGQLAGSKKPAAARHNPFRAFLAEKTDASIKIAKLPGNDICADCSKPEPEWAVVNIGVVVCLQCSGCHRDMGVNISKVRSLTLDSWSDQHLNFMLEQKGNTKVNACYEARLRPGLKPQPGSNRKDRQRFISEKYEHKNFYAAPAAAPKASVTSTQSTANTVDLLNISVPDNVAESKGTANGAKSSPGDSHIAEVLPIAISPALAPSSTSKNAEVHDLGGLMNMTPNTAGTTTIVTNQKGSGSGLNGQQQASDLVPNLIDLGNELP